MKIFTDMAITALPSSVSIQGQQAHHIRSVLRMKAGDTITLTDSFGISYNGVISDFTRNSVRISILDRSGENNEPRLRIVLYQGVPKFDKMEVIIQKSVELGVDSIVPVTSVRCVAKLPPGEDTLRKIDRWNKIAAEAARQSRRNQIPAVEMPVTLSQALYRMKNNGPSFVAWEEEKGNHLRSFLKKISPTIGHETKLSFLIGPEGGFDASEIRLARDYEIPAVTLGPRILRTETAALAVLAMLLYETELSDESGTESFNPA